MNYIQKSLVAIIIFIITSCHTVKDIAGTYYSDPNPVVGQELTLNEDKSFVVYISTHFWGRTAFFGFYEIIGNRVSLKQISGDLSYLNKTDTIIYHHIPDDTSRSLNIFCNEKRPLDGARIFADGFFIGSTNSEGKLRLSPSFTCDSLKIVDIGNIESSFKIRRTDFNQLFVMIYIYNVEPSVNFSFEKKYKINSNGLKTTTTGYLIRKSPDKGLEQKYLQLRKKYDKHGIPVSR